MGDVFEGPPTVERLVDRSSSPFRHPRTRWEYRTVEYEDDEPVWDTVVGMTTTSEQAVVESKGMVFRVVLEMVGPGPITAGTDDAVPHGYENRVGMLTTEGMFLSESEHGFGRIESELVQIASYFSRRAAEWPLPSCPGCEYKMEDVVTEFGNARALVTECANLDTQFGPAHVTTVWVDRVGFVYRERQPLGHPSRVYRDFLVRTDTFELAPSPIGEPARNLSSP